MKIISAAEYGDNYTVKSPEGLLQATLTLPVNCVDPNLICFDLDSDAIGIRAFDTLEGKNRLFFYNYNGTFISEFIYTGNLDIWGVIKNGRAYLSIPGYDEYNYDNAFICVNILDGTIFYPSTYLNTGGPYRSQSIKSDANKIYYTMISVYTADPDIIITVGDGGIEYLHEYARPAGYDDPDELAADSGIVYLLYKDSENIYYLCACNNGSAIFTQLSASPWTSPGGLNAFYFNGNIYYSDIIINSVTAELTANPARATYAANSAGVFYADDSFNPPLLSSYLNGVTSTYFGITGDVGISLTDEPVYTPKSINIDRDKFRIVSMSCTGITGHCGVINKL